MKIRDEQYVKRKGKWIKLPGWLKAWRLGGKGVTLKTGDKVEPKGK